MTSPASALPLGEDQRALVAMLRFVARKTAADDADPRTRALAALLDRAAARLEQDGRLDDGEDPPELAARAFAGFAAFLQRQILPEAVAHANATGERQVRFAIDLAMENVHRLLTAAAGVNGSDKGDMTPP
ncbi:MAG: hypothetical protein RLZZ501_2590 [Pseudomonadota bacterium]